MTELYLLTGFLGAGKTTFLHRFVRQFTGRRLRVIVNEYGKVGVDGALLSELGVGLSEIVGGSIFCSCRVDQFEAALEQAVEARPDVVVVEASGLSDPTGVQKLLTDARWNERVVFTGCICLADAVRLPKVYETAQVCKKQLSVADAVLLNKVDLATPEQLQQARALIAAHRPDVPVLETAYGEIPPGWLERLRGQSRSERADGPHTADLNLRRLTVEVDPAMTRSDCVRFLEQFAEDTYRIKGFARLSGTLCLVDCVGGLVQVAPYTGAGVQTDNRLTVLYGYGLPAKKSLLRAAEWVPGKVRLVD